MVFSSTAFLFLFLPLTILGYYNPFLKSRNFRNRFLLFMSIVFYALGEPVFVFLMLLSIFVGWLAARKLETAVDVKKRKRILVLAIFFHVGLLFIFKYLTFTMQQLGLLLHKDFSMISLALPIGISFFTFQLLSYLFDVYRGRAKAQKSVLNVGLYIALFPQLIAGPIVRYEWIEKEIMERRENWNDFADGMMRFIYGLAKKVLIANYVAQLADNIFLFDGASTVATAWLGALAYTLQIYFDFSAYSDMAIGLGMMFGFHFPENFNYPYISRSATEFWRRWHMTLGNWFRDYVYIPLGGNRVPKSRWVLNPFHRVGVDGHLAWGELDVPYLGALLLRASSGRTSDRLRRETVRPVPPLCARRHHDRLGHLPLAGPCLRSELHRFYVWSGTGGTLRFVVLVLPQRQLDGARPRAPSLTSRLPLAL